MSILFDIYVSANSKKNIISIILIVTLCLIVNANSQEKLPICYGIDVKKWNSCVGVHNVIGQYLYKGEFRNGNKDGYGIYIVTTPAHKGNKYIGEFKNDMKDGLGTYTYANGDNYVGSFKFNKRNGNMMVNTKMISEKVTAFIQNQVVKNLLDIGVMILLFQNQIQIVMKFLLTKKIEILKVLKMKKLKFLHP